MFFEISPELAAEKGVEDGGWMVVWNVRAALEVKAMVTHRIQSLHVNGRRCTRSGCRFHWGWAGETVGAGANDLTSISADSKVGMHEAKAFSCNVRAGRLTDHVDIAPLQAEPWPTREQAPDMGKSDQPEGQLL